MAVANIVPLPAAEQPESLSLKAALYYAAKGWPVIPLHNIAGPGLCSCGQRFDNPERPHRSAGKHPRFENWARTASTDPAVIRGWFEQWPNMNIGIATGAASGLVVADLDLRHAPADDPHFEALRAQSPTGLIQRTGSGGWHLLFKHPGRPIGNRTGVRQGVDIRGDGGLIVVAPSTHRTGGGYAWEEPVEEPGELPEWLRQELTEKKGPGKIPDKIVLGTQDNMMASIAGSLRARGATEDEILTTLRVMNRNRCDPLMDDSDLRRIAGSISKHAPDVRPFALTDTGNAERLAARYGDILRHVDTTGKWFVNDDRRWCVDADQAVQRLAKLTVRAIPDECDLLGESDSERRQVILKFAAGSESKAKRDAMIRLAASERLVAATIDQFDRDPWLLNCQNGTVNLRTGKLQPHRREDMVTKMCSVDYDPDASCPMWDGFLDRIFAGDRALSSYVQRAVGLSLIGKVLEHTLFLMHGDGANGKSTMMSVLTAILNDYSCQPEADLLMARRDEVHPTGQTNLLGVRLAVCTEVGEGRSLSEVTTKRLTGGDPVTARYMHHDFFTFIPSHTLWVAANHLPKIRGRDHAIWRRMRVIPFTVEIPLAEQDRQFAGKLIGAEGPGILAWAVRGCREYQRVGLVEPKPVKEATQWYRDDNDWLQGFLADRYDVVPAGEDSEPPKAARLPVGDVYHAYMEWCSEVGEPHPASQKLLTQTLAKDKKVWVHISHGKRYYVGLKSKATGTGAPNY